MVNRLIATVAGGVTGTTGWTNQRRWRLHRSSKTRQTIGCKGKFSGLIPVPAAPVDPQTQVNRLTCRMQAHLQREVSTVYWQ